jgi:hypothetical protein
MAMNERGAACLALAMSMGLGACQAENTSVGAEGEGPNLARCWGTDCDERAETKKVVATSVGQCDRLPERALELVWERELFGADTELWQLVAAPDGTAWGVGMRKDRGKVIVLSHLALDGSLRGEVEVASIPDGITNVTMDLGCDERGHCYLSWYTLDARGPDAELIHSAHVQEFDVFARPVADAVEVRGIAQPLVRAGAPGRFALAGPASDGARRGSLAVFDAGEVVYIQNGLETFGRLQGAGVAGLAIDREGRTAVLAERYWQSTGPARFGVTRFDAGGSPLWDRTFAFEFANSTSPGLFATDDTGNVTIAGIGPSATGNFPEATHVESLDANGELRWAYELQSSAVAVDAPTGRVFALSRAFTSHGDPNFGTWVGPDPTLAYGIVEEITDEGTSCRRYFYPESGGYLAGTLALGRNDDVYLLIGQRLRRCTGIALDKR